MSRLKAMPPALAALRPMVAPLPREEAEKERFARRDRVETWRAWYKTARWQKLRIEVLTRDLYMCRGCPKPHLVSGKYPSGDSPVADHIKPHRGDPVLFWNPENVQTVCKAYHDSEKQRLEASSR